jgi:hypothetical protein
MKITLYFKPNKGIIEWTNKRALFDYLLANDGVNMYATIDKVKNVRSLDQNAFMWVYLEIIAQETGNIADDLHRLFKGLFLPKKTIKVRGKSYTMSGSTTDLSKGEMTMYLDQICALTNVPIPDPKLASLTKDK